MALLDIFFPMNAAVLLCWNGWSNQKFTSFNTVASALCRVNISVFPNDVFPPTTNTLFWRGTCSVVAGKTTRGHHSGAERARTSPASCQLAATTRGHHSCTERARSLPASCQLAATTLEASPLHLQSEGSTLDTKSVNLSETSGCDGFLWQNK